MEDGSITRWLAQSPPFAGHHPTVQTDLDLHYINCNQDQGPDIWWVAGAKLGFPPKLSELATRLASTNSTSAALERQLSTMRITPGLLRTRLGVEKARKMSFCQRVLNRGDPVGDEDDDDL